MPLPSPYFYIMIKIRRKQVGMWGMIPLNWNKGVWKVVERYKIVYQGGTGELVEKKSRFIADIKPVASEEDALAFVEEMRRKYWDARHHCFAYIIGDRGQTARCSDDGEPSQTAGKQMCIRDRARTVVFNRFLNPPQDVIRMPPRTEPML